MAPTGCGECVRPRTWFFFMTARTLDGPGVVYWTIPSQLDNYARIGKEFYDRINIRAPWNGHGWPPPGMVNV